MCDKFFVISCTVSGGSSLVNNYRIIKKEPKTKFRNEKINNKKINFEEIEKGSIFKVPASLPINDLQSIIKESKKFNSLFVYIYRENFFEKALAWYSWHINKISLDVNYISKWIKEVKKTETAAYNLLVDSNVNFKVITYEDIYENDYNIMIEKLKIINLDLDIETAKLFRHTRLAITPDVKLNGKYNWKPELDIHRDKPGFDICYDLLYDERIKFNETA